MRILLTKQERTVPKCYKPLLCNKEENKIYSEFNVDENWWAHAEVHDMTTVSTPPQYIHLNCLFYWIDNYDGHKKTIISNDITNMTIHSRPNYKITTTPLNFIQSLPRFLSFFKKVSEKKDNYPYIFTDSVLNAINSIMVYTKALLSDSSKPESWVKIYNEHGYHKLLTKRYGLEDVIFELSELCLNNMLEIIDNWSFEKLANKKLRSGMRGDIENKSESYRKMVEIELDKLNSKRFEFVEQFIDSINPAIRFFGHKGIEKSIWRKVNDLNLDMGEYEEEIKEIEANNEDNLVNLIINGLKSTEDQTAIQDHIREDTLHEDHFRDYLKRYIDGEKGYSATTENVTKVDGLSDIKVKVGSEKFTISLKIWNRNFGLKPPVEQLINDMGLNENFGFLIMISPLKKNPLLPKVVTKLIDNHSLYLEDTKKVIMEGDDISHVIANYKRDEREFKVHHIIFETKQFRKRVSSS